MKYEGTQEVSYEMAEEARALYKLTMPAVAVDLEVMNRLMQGAIDTHIHAGPDAWSPRYFNDIDIGIKACELGMGAVVIKCHSGPSARSAVLVQQVVDEWARAHNKKSTKVIGGVVLNYNVGGLNADAVITAAKFGGKFVWTPNVDSSHHYKVTGSIYGKPPTGKSGGIEVVKGDHVVPELKEIYKIIAEYNLVLSIAHHSTRERLIMIDDAREAGISRIVVVHITQPLTRMTLDQAKMMANKGAYLEILAVNFNPVDLPMDMVVEFIREVGADHFVLGTDEGNWRFPHPTFGYRTLLGRLLESGIPETDVEKMARINPEKLIF